MVPPLAADRLLHVLLVEDGPGDVRLTREAFEAFNRTVRLHVVADGVDAMDFLGQRGAYADAPRPDLILLDLHLPRVDGREVLSRVKSDPSLKFIPVVILTTSLAEDDMVRSYELHANSYLNKSTNWDEFAGLIRSTTDFWLTKNRVPRGVKADPI
jgi:CheY-like chemotaxis protein